MWSIKKLTTFIYILLVASFITGCTSDVSISCELTEVKNGTNKINLKQKLILEVNIKNEVNYKHIDIALPDLENSSISGSIESSLVTESTNSQGRLIGKSAEYLINPMGQRMDNTIDKLDGYYIEVHLINNNGKVTNIRHSIKELIK